MTVPVDVGLLVTAAFCVGIIFGGLMGLLVALKSPSDDPPRSRSDLWTTTTETTTYKPTGADGDTDAA